MGRLRPFLPVPSSGTPVVTFGRGPTLQLDLSEVHQRDLFFGLYDHGELTVLRRALAGGGDVLDVGAHIGFYSVAAAAQVASLGGRVLAFEPNPVARAQLQANLTLNGISANVVEVVPKALGAEPGSAWLHVPPTSDPSWSSLVPGRLESEGRPVEVEVTTGDAEAARRNLRPGFVKIDVEGYELSVLAGMTRILEEHRPVVLCEVSGATAAEVAENLSRLEYQPHRVRRGSLVPGIGVPEGIFNVAFAIAGQLEHPSRLRRRSSRAPAAQPAAS